MLSQFGHTVIAVKTYILESQRTVCLTLIHLAWLIITNSKKKMMFVFGWAHSLCEPQW